MKMEFFQKKINAGTSDDMHMLSDLQLVYMVPRNSTTTTTTKFQVEREPV